MSYLTLYLKSIKEKIKSSYVSYIYYQTKGVLFLLVDHVLSDHYLEKKKFEDKHGYTLDLEEPQSFSQKVVWKKINDRNPKLPVLADKYKVKKYVRQKLGSLGDEIIIPTLWVGEKTKKIPFNSLPDEYVIKANHNSGPPIIVKDAKNANEKQIRKDIRQQLMRVYGLSKNEWAYWSIDKKIIAEKLITTKEKNLPNDYKFFMFGGKCELIQVDKNRFSNHKRNLYDTEWNEQSVSLEYERGGGVEKPKFLDEMINCSRRLSDDLDFVRVDLYETENCIYFGEMTHYPGSGMENFEPLSFDFKLGNKWKIEKGNRKQKD